MTIKDNLSIVSQKSINSRVNALDIKIDFS